MVIVVFVKQLHNTGADRTQSQNCKFLHVLVRAASSGAFDLISFDFVCADCAQLPESRRTSTTPLRSLSALQSAETFADSWSRKVIVTAAAPSTGML